jgi:glycosyltransferase involved in cell wall biosynthesis
MVTYQFDYAQGTRSSEKSLLKYLLAPFLERLALSPADLVLVTADWLDEKVKRDYHKKTVLLPNWVDLEAVKLLERNKQRKSDLILYAGRLHWLKGVNILIEAFVQAKQNHPQARLLICGTGDERKRLEHLVESLGVKEVDFLGRVSHAEVLQLMTSAAIFVLPTLTMEGHPKALIEAMACGMACVVSDVPGNRNVILDGRNGLVVPSGDALILAKTLNMLLEDQRLCFQLGKNAMEDATQFDFRYIVAAEIDVLLGLTDTPRPVSAVG